MIFQELFTMAPIVKSANFEGAYLGRSPETGLIFDFIFFSVTEDRWLQFPVKIFLGWCNPDFLEN